jgi:hypothetical protein
MGEINPIVVELEQKRRKAEIDRSLTEAHTLDVQPSPARQSPLQEGWRAYWLGFLGGLALAVVVPLWTGLQEQRATALRYESPGRTTRTPAEAAGKARVPELDGRKATGLR